MHKDTFALTKGINWGLSRNSKWKLWTRVWGSLFIRDLWPILLYDIHYSYLSYCGRATSCTQVSFNSRPELIIESYELYISTSEPTSARNSNEESPVAAVDEILTHCSLSLAWYETAMMESKVVYKNTAGKNTWRLFKKFQWKISRSNGMSEKVFLFFRSCFFSSKPPLIPV